MLAVITDTLLIQQYARVRDPEAFAELVRRYSPMVFSVAKRVTRNAAAAEDVMQECFFELAQRADRIKGSLAGWLYQTAMHRSIDVRRSDAARRSREASVAAEDKSAAKSEWAELEPIIDEAIASLPRELQEPLVLHYLIGQSQAEVADALQIHQSTISRRLETGVAELRKRLKLAGVVSTAALTTLLATNATASVPASLSLSLGKLAVAGVGPARSAVPAIRKWISVALLAAIIPALVIVLHSKLRPDPAESQFRHGVHPFQKFPIVPKDQPSTSK